ncbi:signal peptidase II [Treponema primitia ZAS-2]|uniref:Lipoprotein signal peptidase n=1 Tax=Treponema primitia (strain ATCC BAA-887 / DSM 12427 / ZAS-2) TaxID=545694 RepID=F5YJC3_TREPZ|nr:signal peptidase II [Treponema primitia]AEF86970.1 signal peptidase II [Treponema primitia ZAS-2]
MKIADKHKLLPFLLTGLVILSDQLVKGFIVKGWPIRNPGGGEFIKDVFSNDFLWIIHVRNKAIAFSLGESLPDFLKPALFVVLPLVVLVFLVCYYLKSDDITGMQRWALAGILGGGFGNIIDRIFRPAGVVDFISVKFYGFLGMDRWPTFNIADSSVVVCGILLFLSVVIPPRQGKEVTHEQKN